MLLWTNDYTMQSHQSVYNRKMCKIYIILLKNYPHQSMYNYINLHDYYRAIASHDYYRAIASMSAKFSVYFIIITYFFLFYNMGLMIHIFLYVGLMILFFLFSFFWYNRYNDSYMFDEFGIYIFVCGFNEFRSKFRMILMNL